MEITLEKLKEKGACRSATDLFSSLFGAAVEPTVELCVNHAAQFDFRWCGRLLLDPAGAMVFLRYEAELWHRLLLAENALISLYKSEYGDARFFAMRVERNQWLDAVWASYHRLIAELFATLWMEGDHV